MAKKRDEKEKENPKEKDFGKAILAYALSNAIVHDGKAQATAVLPKLFQHGLKKEDIGKVIPAIQKTVSEVNDLSIEEQKKKLEELNIKAEKKESKGSKGISDLSNVRGKVIMRFAPYPSGPLHIGNARPAILNDEYVKRYGGKLLLVIDDTIGSKEKEIVKDSYKLIPEGLDWLKINYQKPIYKSDRLSFYYKYAEQLIKKDKAYVCFCSSSVLHKNRVKGLECECRKRKVKENLSAWKDMLKGKYKEGKATLRIKTDMKHKNPAFRDRVLFRISNRIHPRVKKKYKVWPLLEMSWAVDDHLLGVTHILRGKDLMMESEMEKYIWKILGWKAPEIIHTGLISIESVKISKSKSQKEVRQGKYIGWDDPRSWSLQSLKKRGIMPEALRSFCLSLGLTQTEATVPVENLYKENKKFVEQSNRYFFVEEPTKIKIKGAEKMIAKLPLHPDHAERGYRILETEQEFFITKKDSVEIKKSKQDIFRLMNLFNFKKINKKSNNFEFHSKEMQPLLKAKLIHWLPAKENLRAEVVMPNGVRIKGIVEPTIKTINVNEIVQFERFGFCRLDKKSSKEFIFWFTHK